MSPTFSIIIPVYNVAPYLRECLDSVLAAARTLEAKVKGDAIGTIASTGASHSLVEVICVDDGSTDGSGAILDEYGEKVEKLGGGGQWSIKVLHQPNRGVSAARNAALDVARGEWISFVDADDCLMKDHLCNFVSVSNKADINFTPMRYVYEDGSVKFCKCRETPAVGDPQSVYDLCYKLLFNMTGANLIGYTFNKFIRASVIKENHIRFVPGLSVSEDEVFIYACLNKANSVSVLADTGYCYKWRSSGLTHCVNKNYMLLYRSLMSVANESNNDLIRDMIFARAIESLSCHYSQTRSFSVALLLLDQVKGIHFETRVSGRRAMVFRVYQWSRFLAGLLFHMICIHSKSYGMPLKRIWHVG